VSKLKQKYVIAVIGGTGKEAKGLAYRWAEAGHKIIIGSRDPQKAVTAANDINGLFDTPREVIGVKNDEAARLGEVLVLTVPFAAHRSVLAEIKDHARGKLVIDVSVPLVPPKVSKVQMPEAGSALMEAKLILGSDIRVASAFQNISYENLLSKTPVDCDVLVCGESKEVRDVVLELVADAGLVGWDAGPIENSMVVEGMTSVLIGINKRYGSTSAGIRITGVPPKEIE
jgi:8-hydroxy-5-deazaflavin:NADPH oxidoreductase